MIAAILFTAYICLLIGMAAGGIIQNCSNRIKSRELNKRLASQLNEIQRLTYKNQHSRFTNSN